MFPEMEYTDEDGNILTGPSSIGITTRATIQLAAQSGTSARRADLAQEGFETEKMFRMRLPRSFTQILGAQSQVEWKGKRYVVFGDHDYYNGSNRTAHVEYLLRRN